MEADLVVKILFAAGAMFCVGFTLTFWAAMVLGKRTDEQISAYFDHQRHANQLASCPLCEEEAGA